MSARKTAECVDLILRRMRGPSAGHESQEKLGDFASQNPDTLGHIKNWCLVDSVTPEQCAKSNDPALLALYLEQKGGTLSPDDTKTMLFEAAKNGCLYVVKYLLENKVADIHAKYAFDSVLVAAAKHGQREVVDYLCQTYPKIMAEHIGEAIRDAMDARKPDMAIHLFSHYLDKTRIHDLVLILRDAVVRNRDKMLKYMMENLETWYTPNLDALQKAKYDEYKTFKDLWEAASKRYH